MTLKELLENNLNDTIFNADASRGMGGVIARSLWTIKDLELIEK